MAIFSNFFPDFCVKQVQDISLEFLRSQMIEALILDLDNTLTGWGESSVAASVQQWVEKMRQGGIKMVILSNGFQRKQIKVSAKLNIPLVRAWLPKPFPAGFRKSLRAVGSPPEKTAVVGDIVFTDIWGASRLGIKTILVEPISKRDFLGTFFWRVLERIFSLRRPKKELDKKN